MSPEPVYLNKAHATVSEEVLSEAERVRLALIAEGLETPMVENGLSAEQKYDNIRRLMTQVMETLGLDLNDDSLTETPQDRKSTR